MSDDHPSPRRASWLHPLRRLRQGRPARNGPPKEPFYKDARVLNGRLRFDVSLRMFLAAVIVFFLAVAAGVVYAIDQSQKTSDLTQQVKDSVTRGRAERLANQKQVKDNQRQLACFFWNYVQAYPDVGLQRVANQIDAQYDCKRLAQEPSPTRSPGATRTPEPATPTPSARNRSAVQPTPSGQRTQANASRAAPRASSAPRTSRSPSSSRPPVAGGRPAPSSQPPSSRPLVDLGPLLCGLLGVDC